MTGVVSDAQEQVLSEPTDAPVGDAPLPCPLCGYDLHAQREPICPECGYRFEWRELLNPRFRQHHYLFEHQRGLIRPYLKTLIGGFLPKSFWSGLQPVQAINLRRLLIYFLISVGMVGSASVVATVKLVLATARHMVQVRSYNISNLAAFEGNPHAPSWYLNDVARYPSHAAYVDAIAPNPNVLNVFGHIRHSWYWVYSRDSMYIYEFPIGVALWPWFTVAALQVFRWSMRAARINRLHVLRCSIYSFDVIVWICIPLAVAAGVWSIGTLVCGHRFLLVLCGLLLCWMVAVFRLVRAYKWYLRFHRPIATVLASQVIVLLMYFNALQIYGYFAGRWVWR